MLRTTNEQKLERRKKTDLWDVKIKLVEQYVAPTRNSPDPPSEKIFFLAHTKNNFFVQRRNNYFPGREFSNLRACFH